MEGEFFFATVTGLGVTLAGFAGLLTALRRRNEELSPIDVWRIRAIVAWSFATALIALALIPVRVITDDLRTTVRIGAAALVVNYLLAVVRNWRRNETIWPNNRGHKAGLVIDSFFGLLQVVNLWVADLGLLEVGFVAMLLFPVSIFGRAVLELARGPELR